MLISNVLNRTEPILVEIELNSVQINQHNTNANMANTGAALSYLFTSNSKNSTVRTLGQVATIGGIVYGSSQKSQANSIERNNIILISQILNIVESEGINNIRQERDTNNIRRFIELNLKTGKYLDHIVVKYTSRFKSKSRLGKKNILLLTNANNIDVFNHKLRLNKIYNQLDPTKRIESIEQEFLTKVSTLKIDKIIKEGLYTRVVIVSLIILGFVTIQSFNYSSWLIISGLLFWGINHYFPFFPETKKLKTVVDEFVNKINLTCGINGISYR
jgi:hypothetical protein